MEKCITHDMTTEIQTKVLITKKIKRRNNHSKKYNNNNGKDDDNMMMINIATMMAIRNVG